MKKKFHRELLINKNYIYISFFISFLTILPQYFIDFSLKHTIEITALFLLLVLTAKFSKIIFATFILYTGIINVIQANIYFHWGSGASLKSRFTTIVQSPLYESLEYLQTYINYQDVFMLIYTLSIFGLLFYYLIKSKHSFDIIKKVSIVFSLILFSFLITKEPIAIIEEYNQAKKNFEYHHPVITKRNRYLENLKINIHNNTNPLLYNKVIIIQGESVNKKFVNKQTSPFLYNLLQNKKAYTFNIIAGSNQTRYSVPMIFTNANVSNWKKNFIHSESIITNFKENGYKTYWISNQGRIGKFDDWVTNIANEADIKVFFNKGDFTHSKSDIVIKKFLTKIKNSSNKEMFVFHLMGSHSDYTKRYTKQHLLYKNPKNIIEEYKNSIYFTDYIIKNIYNHFKNKGTLLLIYLSDHGEVVSFKKHGHGLLPTYKDEYEVPLIILSNKKNERLNKLNRKNLKNFFNHENMNSVIKYISYLSNDVNISTSPIIFSCDPEHKFNFNKIDYYK